MTRINVLQITITPAFKAHLEKCAKKCDMSLAQYIRESVACTSNYDLENEAKPKIGRPHKDIDIEARNKVRARKERQRYYIRQAMVTKVCRNCQHSIFEHYRVENGIGVCMRCDCSGMYVE